MGKRKLEQFQEAERALRARGFEIVADLQCLQIRVRGYKEIGYVLCPGKSHWWRTDLPRKGPAARKGNGLRSLIEDHEAEVRARRRLESAKVDVTVFADASVCQRTGAAGWGAWIKGGAAASITKGGPLEDLHITVTEAEIRAMANALHVAKAAGILREGAGVMLQSDCIIGLGQVLAFVPGAADRPAKGGLPVQKVRKTVPTPGILAIQALVAELRLTLLLRHVKGHQGGTTTRSWVNEECDRQAKAGMQARRARAIQEGSHGRRHKAVRATA